MNNVPTFTRVSVVFLCISIFAGCSSNNSQSSDKPQGEPDSKLPAPTQSTPPTKDDSASDSLDLSSGEILEAVLARYKHLDEHFRLMDRYGVESELGKSLAQLRHRPDIVNDVSMLYGLLTETTRDERHDYFGEARWRAVHLLGELKNPEAQRPLFAIATDKLPAPESVSEDRFSSEYRIRARAIEGLEKLKDVELLTRIYDEKNLLSGVAAASLYELGAPPKGVVAVDGRKVLGPGDSTDFKVIKSAIDKRHLQIPGTTEPQEADGVVVPADTSDK